MTNDEEHFEYQLKHGTHAISKENMLKIADLDRKRFLKLLTIFFYCMLQMIKKFHKKNL